MNAIPNDQPSESEADGTAVHPHTSEEVHDKSQRNILAIVANTAYLWGLVLVLLAALAYLLWL
jgi:hypothetical protein